MEEDWYSMEWVLVERKRALAAREACGSHFRSPTREVQRLAPGTPEETCWRGLRKVAEAGAVALLGAIAPALMLVKAPPITKHWRRPDGR
jgi:hypothetical protein